MFEERLEEEEAETTYSETQTWVSELIHSWELGQRTGLKKLETSYRIMVGYFCVGEGG